MLLEDFTKIKEGSSDKKGSTYGAIKELHPLVNWGLSVNLGLRRYKNKKTGSYYKTDRWCGCCWLKSKDGIVKDKDGNPQVLQIKCRFDDYLRGKSESALVNMISVISKDEEFPQYLCTDLPEGERLITFFTEEDLLPGDKLSEDNRLITVISFISVLEKLTRRCVMRHTVRQTENLTGNIRGKILFSKHISKNLAQGRQDRIYCQYTTRTEDTPENRFLKYALKKAAAYLQEKFSSMYEKYSRDILVCLRRLSAVADVQCNANDLDRIILPGMYMAYRPALQLAKVILTEISMNTNKASNSFCVIPYAVNMPLLFECYARTRIKEALEIAKAKGELKIVNDKAETKKDIEYKAELLPFVPDKQNLPDREGSYLPVFSENRNCYIRGNLIPDIVIAYREEDQSENSKPKFYRVYDVKYKDRKKAASRVRDDRLQILAYDFMYGSDNSFGHIFPDIFPPKQSDKTEYVDWNGNRISKGEDEIIQKKLFARKMSAKYNFQNNNVGADNFYMELYLDGGSIEQINWLTI